MVRVFDLTSLNLQPGTYYIRVQAVPNVNAPVRGVTPATYWGAPSNLAADWARVAVTITTPPPVIQFTVTFNTHNGTPVPPQQNVVAGGFATLPTQPSRANHNFLGWFTAQTGGTLFNFAATPITGNITLHAQWQFVAPGPPGTGPVLTIATTGVTIPGADTRNIRVGETVTLSANVLPANATNRNVTWTSSDSNVASVNANGVVTGVAVGTAVITVTTAAGGHTAQVTINVTAAEVDDDDDNDYDIDDPDVPLAPPPRFTDVGTQHWANNYVNAIAYRGIMLGITATIFEPETTLNRAMAATILWRLAGEPSTQFTPVFTDVIAGQWYSEAITWGSENGILLGIGNNLFNPRGELTREQFAALMFRYAQFMDVSTDVSEDHTLGIFADYANVGDWAIEYMLWANYVGLIGGVDAQTLLPGGSATRAQTAAILYRFMAFIDSE
jgi:uncharacterized repeat protein (TIGR02543 family)